MGGWVEGRGGGDVGGGGGGGYLINNRSRLLSKPLKLSLGSFKGSVCRLRASWPAQLRPEERTREERARGCACLKGQKQREN